LFRSVDVLEDWKYC